MPENFLKKLIITFLLIVVSAVSNLYAEEKITAGKNDNSDESSEKVEVKRGNKIFQVPKNIYNYLKDRPEEMLKYLQRMEYYKHSEKERNKEITTIQNEADVTGIRESAHEDINSIIVLVGELPADKRDNVYAPIFLTDSKKIFGTITDFSFKWVGYKSTVKFQQNSFPWKNTSLSETVIGSFLYASGTNIGFNRGKLEEENRFYTNYTSEILTLKIKFPLFTSIAMTLDSRQYFFVKRDTPKDFIMPLNHINLFPRMDVSIDLLKEKGIDQLTSGFRISSWAGYGIRNRWEEWGEPDDLQTGEKARKFVIYSSEITAGLLFLKNHNLVIRARHKGGIDNDFLTRPRFGGTIDNAKLDVVHGFTIDQFRVKRFGIINTQYGFDIIQRLRFNLFFDYAHVFSPDKMDIIGTGYGFRILAWGGLPIWLTHGIGRIYSPEKQPFDHVFMIMSAAGW